jgi:hypothetical protein
MGDVLSSTVSDVAESCQIFIIVTLGCGGGDSLLRHPIIRQTLSDGLHSFVVFPSFTSLFKNLLLDYRNMKGRELSVGSFLSIRTPGFYTTSKIILYVYFVN